MYTGSRYQETKDLDIAEVAKLIRVDLAEEKSKKDSPLFGLKTSVRIQRYSMGQAIHLEAKVNPASVVDRAAIKKALFTVGERYNYDRSDPQSDYFDRRFHVGTHIGEIGGVK
jgi:hypothetical protein